jgi:hypothetical protein
LEQPRVSNLAITNCLSFRKDSGIKGTRIVVRYEHNVYSCDKTVLYRNVYQVELEWGLPEVRRLLINY